MSITLNFKSFILHNNVDETGMPLETRPPKVVTARGKRNKVCVRTSGNKV